MLTSSLRKAIGGLPDTLPGTRDRALLLVGFAAALRRSELVALEVLPLHAAFGWIEDTEGGLKVHLARSKADQKGFGMFRGLDSAKQHSD